MRCGRCGKHFDEEMYCGICPKCGYFNNRQAEYDVSKYFSAKFDDGGKVSTGAQAAKQHEKLHEMYDKHNMHKPQAAQSRTYQAGAAQGRVGNYPQAARPAMPNPYQQSVRQGNAGQAKPYGKEKEKNIVTPVCVIIAVAAIVVTVAACSLKKREIAGIYQTVEFEQETAEAGQIFEVNGRLLVAEKAEVVDTSLMSGIAEEEKLVAVTVKILPAEEWDGAWADHIVYLSDGRTCRQCLDSYALDSLVSLDEFPDGEDPYAIMEELYDMREAMEKDILTEYNCLGYDSLEGKTGKFYFLTGREAENVTISFDQEGTKSGVSVLEKRVGVPLVLEEVSG